MGPPFLALTIKYNGLAARITAEIQLSLPFDPAKPPDPAPPMIKTMALWDTGSTGTVLTAATVKSLGLAQVGSLYVKHGGGRTLHPTYLVNVYLPNKVAFPGALVTALDGLQDDFGAIVGMDIMGQGDLSITNVGGTTWMSFRIPSVAPAIDYVADSHRAMGVGRNDPCFCRSGKKYKKCHGSPAASF